MEYIQPLLIGGALPIITIVINRAFDLRNLRKSHELSLSKQFFEKKLQAFEKATSYYTIAHLSISSMSMMFKNFNKENVDFDEKITNSMFQEIQSNLKEVYKVTQEGALSLPLYTSIQLPETDEEYVEKYIELLGEINSNATLLNLANLKIEKTFETQEKKRLEEISNKAFKELGEKIELLYSTSKIIKEKYKGVIKSLRSQLATFDV